MENGDIHHVYIKSISNYVIFRENADYERMRSALQFFLEKRCMTFSKYMLYSESNYKLPEGVIKNKEGGTVDIIAYCIMPTHLHLILRQKQENSISRYMNRILISYTKHFNSKHRRKGPLWESRFKKILLEEEEDILYMIRYLHLNPVLSFLVDKPEKWEYSSYSEYNNTKQRKKEIICDISCLKINQKEYKKITDNNGCFQEGLRKIQPFLLE